MSELRDYAEPSAGFEQATTQESENKVVCPVCGAATVQEKCKVICRSEVCRGRIVMNCSEF